MELDEALKELGDFGLYQSIVYVLICVVGQLTQSWHMLAISFLGADPKHHCTVPGQAGTPPFPNPWENYPVDPGQITDGDQVVYSSCLRYANFTVDNTTESCDDGWTYDMEEYGNTIVTRWNLVCNDAGKVDLSTSIFMAGVMVGSLISGQLSDRFGRKPIWFGSIWIQIIFAIGVAFSPNYWTFVVLRFFVGVFEQGVDLTSYVMVTEMFSPAKRGQAGILLTIFWATGIMSLPGLAYLIKDWRYLQLAITLPNALTVSIITIIPESMRWLMSHGKLEEAEEILQTIAKFNGKDMPKPILSIEPGSEKETSANNGWKFKRTKVNAKLRQVSASSDTGRHDDLNANGDTKTLTLVEGYSINDLQSVQEDGFGHGKHHTLIDLFRTRNMRKISIIMIFIWFVNSVVYYGLSLNTDSLAGDPYLNFFISGAVEIPAYLVATVVVNLFGRRLPLCVFHIIGGVACITTVFVPNQSNSGVDLTALIVTIAMVGKFCIAASYAIAFLYASELFPTVLRNLGLGVSSFSSRVGGIVAPLLLLLEKYLSWLPLVIFGVLSILAGCSVLPLPETLSRNQPQTVQDVEDFNRYDGKEINDNQPFAAHLNTENADTKL